jgi:hypothetical protein
MSTEAKTIQGCNPSAASSAPDSVPPPQASEAPPPQTSSAPPPTQSSNSPPPTQATCSPAPQHNDCGGCDASHTPVISAEVTAGHQAALLSADVHIGPHADIVAADVGVGHHAALISADIGTGHDLASGEVGHQSVDLIATVHAGLDLGADVTLDLLHGHCG